MSVNKHRPHVLVLPEDDADRQLANGFHLALGSPRQIQVLPEIGGWGKVLDRFNSDHVRDMSGLPHRSVVLVIDFDGDLSRLEKAKESIPVELADRVFVIGVLSEPEVLKADLCCSLEAIGVAMASDCREGTSTTWGHPLLQHNAGEIERLHRRVRPVLFESV